MTSISRTALVLAILGGLAACGGGDNQTNQPAGAETANETAEVSGPFSEAEQRMNEAMMSAVGVDAGDNWAKKIVPHHQGAIEMSKIVLQQNPNADVARMARTTTEKQRKDIEDIRKLFKNGAPNPQAAELYRAAMMDMHQKMQAVSGADASETFMRKMLEHHRGGVAMSDVALQNGVAGALREQVQKTRDNQQKDAEMVEAMLRGETMQHAMGQAGATSAEEAKAEPAPADRPMSAAKPAVAAAPKAEPKAAPAAEPKAEPKAPAPTCLPEHRAAGHC